MLFYGWCYSGGRIRLRTLTLQNSRQQSVVVSNSSWIVSRLRFGVNVLGSAAVQLWDTRRTWLSHRQNGNQMSVLRTLANKCYQRLCRLGIDESMKCITKHQEFLVLWCLKWEILDNVCSLPLTLVQLNLRCDFAAAMITFIPTWIAWCKRHLVHGCHAWKKRESPLEARMLPFGALSWGYWGHRYCWSTCPVNR